MDFRGEPFDPMPQIMAVSEQVTKLLYSRAKMKVMSQDAEHIIL